MKQIARIIPIIFLLLSCQKNEQDAILTKITIGPGPEDLVYDASHHRILASCSERRNGYPSQGNIWQLPLDSAAAVILPLVNFPSGMPFHPHGFDLQTVSGQLYLYVIDHFQDNVHTTAIVRFKVNADNLEYDANFQNHLLISPNDLTVFPDGSLYFSNDAGSNNELDIISKPKSGSLVYFDGMNTWKKVDSIIAFPNGVYNENGKLYLATSRNNALYKYDIQPDGSVLNRVLLNPIDGMDNITDHGDELIVAVHPDEIKFALLTFDPTLYSPCKTYAINKTSGEASLLFQTDGSLISGASTSLVVGDDLYMGQVFGNYLLKISNYRHGK